MTLFYHFIRWTALVCCLLPMNSLTAADYNAVILEQLRSMPRGGGYSTSSLASANLRGAVGLTAADALRVEPAAATPSYCSGATYLVFLKTLAALEQAGRLRLSPEVNRALLVRSQPDGTGIWGRWNANGPGTARLFHELGLGRNFEGYEDARPGDFMKIFWTSEVGARERGHLVVYLGRRTVDGEERVRFWSSNQPGGYGEKEVPRARIAHAFFSRLEHPEALAAAPALPKADHYLASLLEVRSSIAEARSRSGIPATPARP